MLFELFLGDRQASLSQVEAAHDAYRQHLTEIEGRLPASVAALAKAPWHYDFSFHECPHDAWVNDVRIAELAQGDRAEMRRLQIEVALLGAYHDGEIEIVYKNVRSYAFSASSAFPNEAHGDWLVDEIRLSEAGLVLHEVLLSRGRWLVECEDVEWRWKPAG